MKKKTTNRGAAAAKIEDGMLEISFPIKSPFEDRKGKRMVASTGGAWQTGIIVEGKWLMISLIAFIRVESAPRMFLQNLLEYEYPPKGKQPKPKRAGKQRS
jgi:hypothetical protein